MSFVGTLFNPLQPRAPGKREAEENWGFTYRAGAARRTGIQVMLGWSPHLPHCLGAHPGQGPALTTARTQRGPRAPMQVPPNNRRGAIEVMTGEDTTSHAELQASGWGLRAGPVSP